MNLQAIVAVSGKPGLWKALVQNKTGFILESLDAQKTKMVANLSTAKMAALDEITVFGEDEDIKLTDILERMKSAASVPDAKADGKALRNFFREVAPEHDEEKVYSSDIKKIITWFNILKDLPLFNEEVKTAAKAPVTEEAPVAQEIVTETPKKAKAPKAEEAETPAEEAEKAPKAKKAAVKKA
ncbi:DUF5606 family protein [Mucilaginibacter auburnensis]|uniref:Uncharacterized protein n=1 Tax=Mucilaginibacter auburnensis TaxID=1457233 RepID=A0A2H9VMA6_9SPHI|nr:DUF5606 domain-containing protein [Mucilaginibacter auburnensis]PJJ79470.1 hypothetical protein CLV57_2604 [Mucilaginibacter auburnensis]